MPFVAQLPEPTSYSSIGWLAVAIAAGAGALNQILKLLDRNKPTPPLHVEYATKAEMRALEERFSHQFEELREEVREAAKANEERVIRLHGRVDDQTERIISIIKDQR